MSEFGQDLLGKVGRDFENKLKKDRKLKRLAKRIRDGTSYDDASEYSVRLGELLSESLLDNTETLSFMSEEVASEVLYPMLTTDHDLLTEVVNTVQTNMNEADGLGLSALLPDLDTNRIDGLISKISSYEAFTDARWLLAEPIVNYSQAVIDEGMRKNAEASARLGLKAVIRRKTAPTEYSRGAKIVRSKKGKTYSYPYSRYVSMYRFPCDYCSGLAGTYDYDKIASGDRTIYRRHEHCRCTLTFERGRERQYVWWKQEWTDGDAEGQRRAYQEAEASREARDAIRDARARKAREEASKTEAQKEAERKQRTQDQMYLMQKLNISARGAYDLLEKYSDEVKANGLDWLVSRQRRS